MENKNQKPVAIITGGSRGIGRAISIELAQHGYHTVLTYRTDDGSAAETQQYIDGHGWSGEAVKFDVTDPEETATALQDVIRRYETIEVLVNNAGVIADGLFVMMAADKWNTVIETTLKGFFNVTQPVLQHMVRKKRGAIVSISSAAGLVGNRGQANYSAAKAGLVGACRTLSTEVARLGIRVNVVAPGLVETEMSEDVGRDYVKNLIPMGRLGRPEEVARVVRFLCSDDASYISGQVISVNGGMF